MKLILSHLRPREEFNGRSLGYFTWMKGWLAKPCQQGHIWTTGTIRIRDLTTARTPLSFISAFLSMLALFALYWQSDIFHMVNIMAMDSSHPQGGTNTFSLVSSIEFGGHALIEVWVRCSSLSQSTVAQWMWAVKMASYFFKKRHHK